MNDDYIDLSGVQRRAILDQVLLVYGARCWLCRLPIKPGDESVDHVVPRSKGGTSEMTNLRPAHLKCNSARGNRDISVTIHDDSFFWLATRPATPRPADISPPMT